jgi:hypothetical protein
MLRLNDGPPGYSVPEVGGGRRVVATELLNPFQKHLYTHVLGRADTGDRLTV